MASVPGNPMPELAGAIDRVEPNLTVLLDLPPSDGLRRIGAMPDRFERETLAFHERVRDSYLHQASKDPASWLVLDGTRSMRDVGNAVWLRVQSILPTG